MQKKNNNVKCSAVVVKGEKIYYLFVSNKTIEDSDFEEIAENEQWDTTVVVGDVKNENQDNELIKWETSKSESLFTPNALKNKLQIESKKILPVGCFGFVVSGKIVFAIQGEAKEVDGSKDTNFTAFFRLEEASNNLELLHVESTGKCHSTLFFWKEQIVMVPSVCTNSGSKQQMRVFEYKNDFESGNNSNVFLHEFLRDKENFVTTKINGTKDLLLFTQQTKNTNEKYDVYLWVTDGIRTTDVGTIITEVNGKINVSLLHTNNELFALHNKYETEISSVGNVDKSKYNLRRLKSQLATINLVLNAWKITDDKIKDFFKDTSAQTPSFTEKLVGFLSGNSQDNQQWKDEYFYENATVTNGTRDSGGFKFSGAKAGAKWLVGKSKKKYQPYNFADPGFTLVATVKIDKDTNDKWNSILGVGLKGTNDKTIGLWCSKGVWGVGDVKDAAEAAQFTTETCVQEEKYQVVLILNERKEVSVYIDGKLVDGLPTNPIVVQQQPLGISHFYFGVNDAAQKPQPTNIESHVTVTNVILYNRPFDVEEVKNLKECPKNPKVIKNSEENLGTNTQGDNQQPTPPPDPNGEEKKEAKEALSPSRTEDGCVCGGVRVFSLLLAVLCVSAPLLHL